MVYTLWPLLTLWGSSRWLQIARVHCLNCVSWNAPHFYWKHCFLTCACDFKIIVYLNIIIPFNRRRVPIYYLLDKKYWGHNLQILTLCLCNPLNSLMKYSSRCWEETGVMPVLPLFLPSPVWLVFCPRIIMFEEPRSSGRNAGWGSRIQCNGRTFQVRQIESILCFFTPKISVISSPQSLFLICFCKKDKDSHHPKMVLYFDTSTAPLGPPWTLAFPWEKLGVALATPSSFVAGLSLGVFFSFYPPGSLQRPLFKFAVFVMYTN